MSHASTTFYFRDGAEWYGEYNGTSDIQLPMMFDTPEERTLYWRKQNWDRVCKDTVSCKKEEIVAESYYGFGFCWRGKGCRACGLYLGPYECDPYWGEFKGIEEEVSPTQDIDGNRTAEFEEYLKKFKQEEANE